MNDMTEVKAAIKAIESGVMQLEQILKDGTNDKEQIIDYVLGGIWKDAWRALIKIEEIEKEKADATAETA